MPSKYGFGNTRKKSPYKKANYGGDQKNPIKMVLAPVLISGGLSLLKGSGKEKKEKVSSTDQFSKMKMGANN